MGTARRVDKMGLTPQQCVIGRCNEPGFDTGVDYFLERGPTKQRIYIGETAIGWMASEFGWLSPADAEKLNDDLVEATVELERVKAELANYEDIRRVMAELRELEESA